MAISNKGNLSNLCYLTEIGGVKILRKVFLKRVVELKPATEDHKTWSVDRFLNVNKRKIESANLSHDSMLIIFPVGGYDTNLDLWDFSMFFCILKVTCSLSPSLQINLQALKKIHDKTAHVDDLKISDAKYKNYEEKLRYIFENTLNEIKEMDRLENIREMFERLHAGKVPETELSKAMLVCRQCNCEERKNIVKAEYHERSQRLERGNSQLLATLNNIKELLSPANFGLSQPTIPVKIKTSRPDMENHLTDVLVEMFNNEMKDLRSLQYTTDVEERMREAVHTFFKTFKEKGYEIIRAEQGCILLLIQFSSVVSLLSFYFDYLHGDLETFLDCLQKASRDFLRYQELKLEIILYKDDFQQALSDIQDHGDWTGNRRLASIPDYNQMELFEKDWNIASIRLTVKPPPNFERVELKQLIIAEFTRLSKAFTFSTFTLKNLKRICFGDDEDTPKKFTTNGKKSDPHIQLRSMTDGYSDGDTERHDCTKTGNGVTLRQFVVPSAKYRRYYYTYNNVQHIAKKYRHIVRAFNRSYEIDLPCFDDVNLFIFSGDTTVDLSVVDDASRENVKKPKFTTFGSIEEIVRDIDRLNENGVSIFISTKDIAERLDYIRFSPHIILVDDDKPKYLQFDEIQNVKVSSHRELAKTISSLLEDMLLKHLVKMIKVLEDILHVNSSSSSRQEASVSTDFHSEKENQGYGTQGSTTEDLKKVQDDKVQDDAQELYEDILALFYRAGKPWKTAFQDMVKTLDNEIAKEILQVPGVTSVGYKLDVLNLFLDNSMIIEGRLLTENRLKCLLKKQRISRYEFHYEQGKPEQYAEVGSVLNVGQGEKFKGALGCFVKLGEEQEMCILFSKHVSLRGTDLFIEDPLGSGILVRFATLLSSNRHDSGPLDIAIAKVFNPANHQVQFKDEFGKCLPSIVCLFDNLTWLHRLPVHISRAVGEPGLGIVIIPVLYMGDAKNICYLKIEDRDANKRFANPGDSGSIVCANDINDGLKVHIIAMLIGSSNEDEVNQSSTTKRQYVAFRLNMGVDQLKKELNKEICFYE